MDVLKVCCATGYRFGSYLSNFHFGSSGCMFEFMGLLFLFFFKSSYGTTYGFSYFKSYSTALPHKMLFE